MPQRDRGQTIGIARLFLGLGVGAIVFYLVSVVTSPLFDRVNNQTQANGVAAQGTTYLQQGVEFLPIAFLLISVFGLIAYSVFQRVMLG